MYCKYCTYCLTLTKTTCFSKLKKKNLRYGDTKLHVPHGLTAGNGANTST